MKTFFHLLLLAFFTLAPHQLVANTMKLPSFHTDTTLPHMLLIEALQRAQLDYEYLYGEGQAVSNTRILNDLKTGSLDVMWTMTSKELETEFQAIYYPLFRGLLGMRLGIVKEKNRELFRSVTNLQDLRRFKPGQGKVWADTIILEHNGLKVAKTLKYENLFYMLEGERFDYFPRGINEPWGEVERFADLNLVVEPYLIIKYRAPMYLFVRKDNVELRDKLTDALENMVQDGTFEKLFFDNEQVQSALGLANVKQRKVIDLENPGLTSQTPLNRTELWFDPLTYNAEAK